MHITDRQRVDVIIAALEAYAYNRRDLGERVSSLGLDANSARAAKDAAIKQEAVARAIRTELQSMDMPRLLAAAVDSGRKSPARNLGRIGAGGSRPQLHLPS